MIATLHYFSTVKIKL